MSSTQQHIVLKVDDKVVYDSSSPATTTPAPAAALTRPAEDIDVKKLKVVEKPISKTEYYVVTYDVKNPTVLSKPEKVTFISKTERESGSGGETTYTYTVVAGNGKEVTYDNYADSSGSGGGTEVIFYEIPLAGGKRRNNRRKSTMRKGGRSRRMRRANNRKI